MHRQRLACLFVVTAAAWLAPVRARGQSGVGDAGVVDAGLNADARTDAVSPMPGTRDGGAADFAAIGAAPDAAADSSVSAIEPEPAPAPAAATATATAPGHLEGRAASVPLSGTVRAKGTRRPLEGAVVFVDGVPATSTGTEGQFTVPLGAGKHRIVAQAADHQSGELVFDVSAANVAANHVDGELSFYLRSTADSDLFDVVVYGHRDGAPRVNIPAQQSRTTPGSFGDPVRVIESLPGVSQVVWPLALYAVRGANPGNTGFFLDGMRVPTHFHFLLGPSVVHPYFIEGINFFAGAYPVRYGRFTSGIVAAQSAAPPADRLHLDVDVRLIDAGALVASPIDHGRGSVAAAARYSYTGLIVSALSDSVRPFYADYQLRAEHRLGNGRLILFALGSYDTVEFLQTRNDDGELQFHRVSLRWLGPTALGRLEASLAAGRDATRTTYLESPMDVRSYSITPRLELLASLAGGRLDLQLGADAELQRFMPRPPPDLVRAGDIVRTRSAAAVGLYSGLSFRVGERLSITPAFRLDQFFEQGVARHEPGPRLFIRADLTPRLAIVAAGGRFSQMPSLPVAAAGLEAFGLATLGPQWSYQASLQVEAQAPLGLAASATAFVQRFRLSDIASQFSRDPQRPDYLVMRDGHGEGLEIMLRRTPNERLSGWLAYTLSRSIRDFDGVSGPSDWDQRHILNLVLGWRFTRSLSGGARFHYNTGRPYPVTEAQQVIEYRRLPAFYQLDLRIDRRFVFDRFILSAYVELVNATLTRQVVSYSRSEAEALVPSSFRLVLPSIGVHGSF